MAEEENKNTNPPQDDKKQAAAAKGAQQAMTEEEKKKKAEEEARVRKEMGFSDDFLGDDYTPSPGDFTDDKKQEIKNFKIGAHDTKFDEQKFKDLLAESISLSYNEKTQILKAVPKLSQFQIDELMNILEEEQVKLKELNAKHADKLKEFEEKKANSNWDSMAAKAEEDAKKEKDKAEIDKLKGNLDDL
ncbi:MAG: hypothetical protein PHU71_02950 [Candidatus Gracilibacteria bacterium]|nr:hypothetical protein [Candidatus Gracilibacteria bacterium]